MNFNFKVRAKNPLFWIANIVAVLVYIGGYLGVKGTDVTSWDKLFSIVGDVVANPYLIVMIIVTFATTAISYTDKGFKDTGIVQTYTKTRNEKIDPLVFQNKADEDAELVKRGAQEPEEFDTSQPFTEDSEDVEFDVAEYEEEQEK